RKASEGLPVVLTQPTMPIGAGDRGPTPSGRLVLDFLNGKIPAYVDTTLNIVDVRDVAIGHLLAGENGKVGRSYILGGTNLSMAEILGYLSEITGLRAPTLKIPRFIPLGAAYLSEFFQSTLARKQPFVELEAVRMSGTHMAFDDSRARNELGHSPRKVTYALASAVEFYLKSGYVKENRIVKVDQVKLKKALQN
ncbi:MAG: NAD-dependent dehydratase, partial [Acidimicrobiales bacterium]|nr:NAD-dependent dehydratase [Acidimicrobiales bacterium]